MNLVDLRIWTDNLKVGGRSIFEHTVSVHRGLCGIVSFDERGVGGHSVKRHTLPRDSLLTGLAPWSFTRNGHHLDSEQADSYVKT